MSDYLVIGIAGGTGSGKTTLTNQIAAQFIEQVTIIKHDNYYKAHDDMDYEERCRLNYDHPNAFDTELMIEHLKALKNGETIECPIYDFTQHNRSNKSYTIHPSKVFLIEGILIFSDEQLRDLFDIKVFVEADADERILRRVVRDVKERGRDINNIMEQYLTTVKPMHALYVEPTKTTADIIINSGMNDVAFDIMRTKIETLLKE